jgi:hypothetical protein
VNRVLPAGVRGTALGVLWAVHMLAVAGTSQLGAMLADLHHNYTATIIGSAVLTTASVLLVVSQSSPDAVDPTPVDEPAPAPAEV